MKVTRFLVSILFLGVTASASFAQGVVSLTWDTCIGPIDKAVAPGSASNGMVMSVINHSAPHKAYDVRILMTQPGGLKDAWRMDASGCQGSAALTIDHLSPTALSKACPSFMQTSAPSLQIKDYSFDPLTGKARGVLANSYPNGVPTSVAATRYFLVRFLFDQTFGVNGAGDPPNTCGGLDAPLCSHILNASWLSLDGIETQWTIGSEFVTANDPQNSAHCPAPTAVKAATWGSLKSQYRGN